MAYRLGSGRDRVIGPTPRRAEGGSDIPLDPRSYEGSWVLAQDGNMFFSNGVEWVPTVPQGAELIIPAWVEVPSGWFEVNTNFTGDLSGRRLISNKFSINYVTEDVISWAIIEPENLYTDAARTVPVSGAPSPVGGVTDISGNGAHWYSDVSAERMEWRILNINGVDTDVIVSPATSFQTDFDQLKIPVSLGQTGSMLVFFEGHAFYTTFKEMENNAFLRFTVHDPDGSSFTNGVTEVVVLDRALTAGEKEFFIQNIASERNRPTTEKMPSVIDGKFRQWRFIEEFPFVDTSDVTSANSAWASCVKMKTFPLINLDNLEFGRDFWNACTALEAFPAINLPKLRAAQFAWGGNQGLTSFPSIEIPVVSDFSAAWYFCRNLLSFPHDINLGQSATSGIAFNTAWQYCDKMVTFGIGPLGEKIDLSHGRTFNRAWERCAALVNFPDLDLPNATDLSSAWALCTSLNSFPQITLGSCLYLGTTGNNSTSTTGGAWQGCTGLTSFPTINTSTVLRAEQAWRGCTGLTSFPALDFSSCTNLRATWRDCNSLTSFPAITLKTSATDVDIAGAWLGCNSLTSFPILDTSRVTGIGNTTWLGAWYGCSGLTSFPLLDLSNCSRFDFGWTSCTGLTSFPLIDVSSGVQFFGTWQGCTGLTSFPALNFNFSAPTSIYAFRDAWWNCTNLSSFPANMFDNCSVTNFFRAFQGCALDQTSVDNILVSVNTQAQANSLLNGILDIDAGTNATPSATGQAAADALRAAGWTVTLNGY